MRNQLVFCLLLFICGCESQDKSQVIDHAAKENLKSQLTQMTNAFVSSDYETLIKFTYPAVVEKAGGSEKSLARMKKDIEDLKAQGITYDSISIGQPTLFVKAGNEIHTLIPETLFINAPRGTLMSESYLIAITQDKGKSWYFLDTANIDSTNVKKNSA